MNDDKIIKIGKILDKHHFTLSKKKIIKEIMNNNLDKIVNALDNFGICVREIMKIVYDVK